MFAKYLSDICQSLTIKFYGTRNNLMPVVPGNKEDLGKDLIKIWSPSKTPVLGRNVKQVSLDYVLLTNILPIA